MNAIGLIAVIDAEILVTPPGQPVHISRSVCLAIREELKRVARQDFELREAETKAYESGFPAGQMIGEEHPPQEKPTEK